MKAEDLKIGTEYIVSNAESFYKIKIVDVTKTSIAFIDLDKKDEKVIRHGSYSFDRNFYIQEQLLSEAELFAKFRDAVTPSNYPDKTI